MWRDPLEYVTYELVPTSPAVSRMSGLSNLDSFRDGGKWQYKTFREKAWRQLHNQS